MREIVLAVVGENWFWKYLFSHFGWVDWALVAFVFFGVLIGLKNGIGKEIPRLIEGLISLYLTMEYHGFFASWISRETPWPESSARIFTFLVGWIATWLILRLLFEILGKLAHMEVATPIQWVGGFFIGGIRYFLFFCMLSYFLLLFQIDWIQRSYKVESWSGQTVSQVPVKIHEWINRVIPLKD